MAYAYTGTVLAAPIEERAATPSLFARALAALAESRMHAARRQLRARGFIIDESGAVLDGLATVSLGEDRKLPFAR
jgi:hypothetical protein